MKYKELQEKAKKQGLKYVGVSKDKLEKSIKEAEATPKKEAPKKPRVEKIKEEENLGKAEDRDAVVYSGKHKVRTYTLERHGKDYIKLAEQYVSHPEREEYRIEFEKVETRIMCPHCNKKFRL